MIEDMDADDIVFDEVQIGRGLRPLAQHGSVIVGPHEVTLLGSDGTFIARGTIKATEPGLVRFSRGQTVGLSVDGVRYNAAPGWGRLVGGFVLPGDAKPVKSAAQALLGLLQQRGGG